MGDAKTEPGAVPGRISTPTVDVRRGSGSAPEPHGPFDTSADRFEPRGELGRGGMGRIEDAFDHALGRAVAIKHMLVTSERDIARFAREARITARLEHPGIVPVHDAGRGPDGTPYYVMRRVDGRPLAQIVAGASLADRLALIPNVLAACDALAFAHARGVVHRDLKPDNILVGPFGETLVIDWGLASDGAVASGDDARTVAGTPGFMAPEQARGEPVDARGDVYALGATLFYVLSCELLYEVTPTEMVTLAASDRPPNWRALPARVPADLRAILEKALATDPAQRYGDAGALAADLRRFVTGNLVGAYDYGAWARLARFARRHRVALVVAGLSAIVLAAVAIVSVRRIVAERDQANTARALAETRQHEAHDAADTLLVQRAQELTKTDPVGAVALLRRLDSGSSRWRDAWLAAAAAWTRGIPFGFHANAVVWLQIAADNRHVVTAGRTGVTVFDLATRSQRAVATLENARMCQWIGAHEVACIDATSHVYVVDTERATTRPLDLRGSFLISDRSSRAVIESTAHELVEIGGPDGNTGAARVLATGVELGAASPDLQEIAMWRGDALELWTPAGTRPIAQLARPHGTVQIREHSIVTLAGAEIRRWRVDGDRVVEDGRWPRSDDDFDVALAGSHVYATGLEGLRRVDGPLTHAWMRPASLFATARGFGVFESDGSIGVFDADGWIHLGPYPWQFARAELSPDGHALVAVTDHDDILAWDLGALHSPPTYLDPGEDPIALVPPRVWTRDPARGLAVRDLGHDAQRIVAPGGLPPIGGVWVAAADDARWVAFRDPATGQVSIYDATRSRHGTIDGAVAQATDATGGGIVIVRADGVLREWQPGVDGVRELGTLPSAPLAFSIAGRFVVAMLARGALSRFDLTTHARLDAAFPKGIAAVEIAASGRAWIVSAGELWRWDPAVAPVRVPLADPVDSLVRTGGHILAKQAHAIVALDREPPRVISVEASRTSSLGSDLIAILSPHGVVSIVDLETGGSFALRTNAVVNSGLIASEHTLMFATGFDDDGRGRYDSIDLRIPHDAAALERWLADITNARDGAWP